MEDLRKSNIEYINYINPNSNNYSKITNHVRNNSVSKFFQARDRLNKSLDYSTDSYTSKKNVSFTDNDVVLFVDHQRLLKKKLNTYYYNKLYLLFFGEKGLVPAIDFYFYYVHNNEKIFENFKKIVLRLHSFTPDLLRRNLHRWDNMIKLFIKHEKAIIIQNYIRFKLSKNNIQPILNDIIKKIETIKKRIMNNKFKKWIFFVENDRKYYAKIIQNFCRYPLDNLKLRLLFRKYFLRNIRFESSKSAPIFMRNYKVQKVTMKIKNKINIDYYFTLWRIKKKQFNNKRYWNALFIQRRWKLHKIDNNYMKIEVMKKDKLTKIVKNSQLHEDLQILNYFERWRKYSYHIMLRDSALIIQNFLKRGFDNRFILFYKNLFNHFVNKLRLEVMRRSFVKLNKAVKDSFLQNILYAFRRIQLYNIERYKKMVISACRIQSYYKIWRCKKELNKELKNMIESVKLKPFITLLNILNSFIFYRCVNDIQTLVLAMKIKRKLNLNPNLFNN